MAENKKKVEEFQIPIEGSLGLLALGDIGLVKWREVRDKFKAEQEKKKNTDQNGEGKK